MTVVIKLKKKIYLINILDLFKDESLSALKLQSLNLF